MPCTPVRGVCAALLLLCFACAPAARAWDLMAGMTQADLHLAEKEAGVYLGVQEVYPVGDGPWVFIGSAEYQLRRGSQIFNYTNPQFGLFQEEGAVSLHCLQPAGFLGVDLAVGEHAIRFYTGASILLKVGESWDEPDGDKGFDLGYEDLDLQLHLGMTFVIDRYLVDARYSAGLLESVVYRDDDVLGGDKAAGDDLPEEGEKASMMQVGVGMSF